MRISLGDRDADPANHIEKDPLNGNTCAKVLIADFFEPVFGRSNECVEFVE